MDIHELFPGWRQMGAGHHIRKEKCNIMGRFTKLLAAVALLGIPLAACEEATPPPPVGSIVGTVSIEGTGVDGVSVNLSNGNSTTTAGGGSYRFDNVEGGAYTVTISGFPSDATFDATSAAATISSAGQSVTINFSGAYIRTASVMGTVTVENMGLPGVTVTLTGVSGATAVTDDGGQYAFTGLRMGSYSVEISGFDNDEVGFSNTAASVAVGVGESKIVSFDGTYLRTAGIMGRVSVEGDGLEGVNVSLTGGPDGVSETTTTDASGQYSFAKLRAGDYAVGISGYDMDDFEFEVTSQNVTVALGETANVPFEGVLLRTSGISGRVSVEGMGLDSIMVTLSMADAEDMMTMTDAGGTYAFSGLAAGAYTVSIAVESDAYVFESMSMDVTVADDQTAIVNFDGTHATTASVSGVVFIDEATKNDMLDEGEHPVAQAGIPVALVGPGVNDQMLGATDSTGAFAFAGLKAGTYQLVFTGAAALPEDFAFGGSAIGYTIALGVGEAHMQNLPIDITHTTVNFSVMLKSGDETGDALPGATVDVYADMAGETKISSGETDDMGMTAIRIERARASGNMVYAGVMAPDGFGVDGDMQMVEWNPQYTMSAATNSQDIVNLKAEVSFAGATITTAMGGGKALSGWGIDVTMMGEDGMEAVEGAPEMLDDDGMGSFMMMAESVADLPMTYYVTFDADQDDEMDGSESYETVDTVMHTHTGLSVDTEMDAGTVTARFTTQTLVVSVYQEIDQVEGFTGNIGTKDVSTTCIAEDEDGECITGVDLELRHETGSNRRGIFDPDVWKWDTSGSDRTVWVDKGVYTFRHLPADYNVFVLADEIGHVEIVHSDNLAAFENAEDNGIMGSAFGAEGGFHHTVSLCPLMAVDPTGQDFGECGSFGFVATHVVAAHVKKTIVKMDDNDDFKDEEDINVEGIDVAFTPVGGQNIAGEAESNTTLKSAARSAGETSSSSTWARDIDERQDLYFGRTPEGVYDVVVSSGWAASIGGKVVGKEFRLDAEDVMDVTMPPDSLIGGAGPFRPSDTEGVYVEVRPTTGILYGTVDDDTGDPLEGVEVTVNGVTVETDIDGRYIVPDFSRTTASSRGDRAARVPAGTKLYVTVSKEGYATQTDNPNHSSSSRRYQITDADGEKDGIDFEANDPQRLDIVLQDAVMLATVTGTVTDKDGDPVAGVDLTVTNEAGKDVLHNRHWIGGRYCMADGRRIEGEGAAIAGDLNCRRTGDDGTYEMQIVVTEDDADYTITPTKTRYYFDDPYEIERLEVTDTEEGLDFEALRQSRIRGSVRSGAGGMGGITVTATAQGRTPAYAPETETNENGRFTIWVDGDERYDVTAVDPNDVYTFNAPDDADGLRVDDDETHEIGTFEAVTFGAGGVKATRDRTEDDSATDADESERLDGNVTVTWNAGTVPTGETITYMAQTKVGDADWADFGTAVTSTALAATPPTDSTFRQAAVPSDSDGGFMVRIQSVTDNGGGAATPDTLYSDPVDVEAVNPSASGVKARRQAASDSDEAAASGNFIQASWSAVTNTSSSFRVVAQVDAAAFGGTVWVVLATGADSNARNASADISGGIASASIAIPSGTGGTGAVTEDELAAAIKIAVEWVQGTADATDEGPKWMRSAAVDLAARGS